VNSVGTIATNQVCPKAKTSSPLTITTVQTLSVQPGCHIPTMDHSITADDSDDLEICSTWLDWTMTLVQLFDNQDTEQLLKLVSQIRTTVSGAFDARELLQRLDCLNKPFQDDHWLLSSPAAMIGIICLIALVTFKCLKNAVQSHHLHLQFCRLLRHLLQCRCLLLNQRRSVINQRP
jgi:hypothetical protein